MAYDDRIERVEAYIRDNLAGDLSLDRLADVAALSPHHFHRVWRGLAGETLAETVRRARMNRAAVLVAMTTRPVAEIARAVGYPNEQSFARAFHASHGERPAEARRHHHVHAVIRRAPIEGHKTMFTIEIRQQPALTIAAVPHQGDYTQVDASFARLRDKLAAAGIADRAGLPVGFYYDDPAATPERELRAHCGMVLDPGVDVPDGFDRIDVPAGEIGVVAVRGPYSNLGEAWEATYVELLPASGRAPGAFRPWEVYLNCPDQTAPEDLLTEICVPLLG